jgi:O-antigen ligase
MRARSIGIPLLAAAAVAFALAVGLAAGEPASGMLLPVGIVAGLAVVGLVVVRPSAGFLVLVFSLFFLLVVPLAGTQRNVNLFDLVLAPLLATSLLTGVRRAAAEADAALTGPAHEAIRSAARRFGTSASLYFGLAALSLLPMALRLGVHTAAVSGLAVSRAVQGALILPLALWWLRDEGRIDTTLRAAAVAVVAFAVVNCVWVLAFGVPRAGMVWWITETREAIGSPNEAAVALLVLWALLQARWATRPSRWLAVLMAVVVVMLPLTQSRSGLLAFAAFLLLTVRRVRWRWILGSLLVLALMLPIVPSSFWDRMGRSLSLQPGTPEMFSLLIRLYSYRTAWSAFLDHPLFGVGYLGLRFVSVSYNQFHLRGLGAENFLLETLVGLGIVGLAAVAVVFARLWALGRAVRSVTPPKTLGHELARFNTPLLVALVVTNLTGSTVVGMVGVGQVALWAALLIRAGHLAVARRAAS